jgi:hypothetical protein
MRGARYTITEHTEGGYHFYRVQYRNRHTVIIEYAKRFQTYGVARAFANRQRGNANEPIRFRTPYKNDPRKVR